MKPSAEVSITKSSGNVFLDLGFPEDEATYLLAHAQITCEILRVVEDRGLTAAAAARLFGIEQPAMRRLLRGPSDEFTIDEMVRMLARAHLKVSMRVSNGRRRVAKTSGARGAVAPAKRAAHPGEPTSSGRKGSRPAAKKRRRS